MKPLSYQKDCLVEIDKARYKKSSRKALVVMASGLGKTVTAALDVKRIMECFPWLNVLYICHQNYILEQAKKTFEHVLDNKNGITFGCYHGSEKKIDSQLLFSSFQTMRDHLDKFNRNDFDYIVVDESHHVPAETFYPVVKYFRPSFVLGMTATPDRADTRDIRKFFGTEVFSLDLPDALAQKLLTPVDYRIVTDEIIDLGKIKNPYCLSMKELNRRIFVPKRDAEIIRIINKKVKGVNNPMAMIFCPSIRYAEKISKRITDSVTIHSRLPNKEQNRRIKDFHKGKYKFVLTVDKFNEGVDIPEVNILVFLRSTQSYTVFYQQLGRGLRKLPGKNKVLVLDFVANCERVELIHNLVEKVRTKTPKRPRCPREPEEETVLQSGSFKFTEKARDILHVLRAKKGGYTREILVRQLQKLAKELGKTPSAKDIRKAHKEESCASVDTFVNYFTKISLAQKAAGLKPTIQKHTKRELIKQLQNLADKNKRVPTRKDINKASKEGLCASLRVFTRHFKNLSGAHKAAGLNTRRYTDKELIRQIRTLRNRLGRTPNTIDIKRANRKGLCATYHTFITRFDNKISLAQKAAGLKPTNARMKYTKNKLIEHLKGLERKLGRTPTRKDIDRAHRSGKGPGSKVFLLNFGKISSAQKAAGLPPTAIK